MSETDSAGGTRESESARQEESTVYITDSEGNRTPYISQTTQPEIEGVTVVAQGGGDALIPVSYTHLVDHQNSVHGAFPFRIANIIPAERPDKIGPDCVLRNHYIASAVRIQFYLTARPHILR